MSGLFGGGGGTNTSETPLTGIQIQSSAYGLPVPFGYGRTKGTPNLLWYGDFTAVPHTTTQSSGGKGGGGGDSTNTTYTYTASLCLGIGETITAVNQVWVDKNAPVTATSLFSVFVGPDPQTPWSYLTGAHPSQALGYSGFSYVAAAGYDLGSNTSLANHTFDVTYRYPLGGGVDDADPRDIVTDSCTNPQYGVTNFPASRISDLSAYSAYCRAAGLLLSPLYDTPQAASAMLTALMQLTNSGMFFSEGLLKITPYGDTALTGNGATYTPALATVADFGEDDYLVSGAEDPVRIKRNAIPVAAQGSADVYNSVTLEILDRTQGYRAVPVTASDLISIDAIGLRPMAQITAHEIADPAVGQLVANLILQRALNIRATYVWAAGWQHCRIEPTDLVGLTEPGLGLSGYPVRVLTIEEDSETGGLKFTAEDAPFGIGHHVAAALPGMAGYLPDYNAAPGNVAAVCILEAPFALAAGTGLEVWAGVSGPAGSTTWGGCNVWGSYDGTTYKLLTSIHNPARVGHLTATLSAGSTGPLALQLDGQGGQLLGASAADAAALNTLFYVGGANPEFMAHQGATLTGANAYSLSGLVRGAYGSTAAAHAIGDPFIRLDDALAKSGSLDLGMIGSTLHFKFQSFNVWAGGVQDLSTLTPYAYTITGQSAIPAQVTGLTVTAVTGSDVLAHLAWDALPGVDHYIIDQSGDGVTWHRTGEAKMNTWADAALYGSAARFRVAAVKGLPGPWCAPVFISISYAAFWDANPATPMWDANPATPMWK